MDVYFYFLFCVRNVCFPVINFIEWSAILDLNLLVLLLFGILGLLGFTVCLVSSISYYKYMYGVYVRLTCKTLKLLSHLLIFAKTFYFCYNKLKCFTVENSVNKYFNLTTGILCKHSYLSAYILKLLSVVDRSFIFVSADIIIYILAWISRISEENSQCCLLSLDESCRNADDNFYL